MRSTLTLLCAALAIGASAPARAAVKVCLKVETQGVKKALFDKLLESELARHPTHQIVKEDCETKLEVNFFIVDKVRYLTARIGRQVPVRYTLSSNTELARRLTQALKLVLGSDPVSLSKDITRLSAMQRALHSVLKRGKNRLRFELFQIVSRSGQGPVGAFGGAVAFSRGADSWRIFARLYFAGTPGTAVKERLLKIFSGGDVGLIYEFSPRANTSFYLGAGVGAQLLHYEGRLSANDPNSLETATKVGGAFLLRAGVRLFRAYDFDVDIFTQGYLPFFITRDVDSPLIDHYTPAVTFGMGIGF